MSEHHIEHNRGWWFPVFVVRLATAGRINYSQMALLGIINALCDPKRGCFASNGYLADVWGKSNNHVSAAINLFEDLGLLKIHRSGDRRVMWTQFDGNPEGSPPNEKSVDPLTKNHEGSNGKSVGDRNNGYEQEEKHSGRSARQDGGAPRTLLGDKAPFDKFILKSCHKLENFVRSQNRLEGRRHNPERWYDEMRLLLQDLKGDREHLVRVLSTYIEHEHDNYTPVANSARSFRMKFDNIERWAKKVDPEGAREPKIIEIIRER